MDFQRGFVLAALLAIAAGCQSYTIMQQNVFVDDDGNVLTVRYGHLESERTTTVRNPLTRKDVEMSSRLAVSLTLPEPNGSELMAYQCMNFLPSGTMYGTDDGKWLFLANGITSAVYLINEDKTDYVLVFSGIMGGGLKKDSTK